MQAEESIFMLLSLSHVSQAVRSYGVKFTTTKIPELRDAEGMTQADLAIKADVSVSIIQKAEAGKAITRRTLTKIAVALGTKADKIGRPAPDEIKKQPTAGIPNDQPAPTHDFTTIPEWPSLTIAASHWVDIFELGEVVGDELIRQAWKTRRFRVRVAGDCLADRWPDGVMVEFVLLDQHVEMIVGEDYYVQTEEGATFKRLKKITETTIVIGGSDGQKKWTVKRSDISRMAIAVGTFDPRRG